VLNISSGLGAAPWPATPSTARPRPAWTISRGRVALDEAHGGDAARIVSLAPGVIDTEMQTQLRAADAAGFPEQALFRGLHATAS
jgi:hypothetical protein